MIPYSSMLNATPGSNHRVAQRKTRKFIKSWEVKDDQLIRHRLIFIRHYFPSVNLDELNDEEFAMLSEDAVWLHSKMLITQQASALGMLA